MSNSTNNPDVCATILDQLGGNRFVAMTGARNLLNLGNGFQCKLGTNRRRITHYEVTLNGDDTYTTRFLKINRRTFNTTVVEETSGVYFDMLCEQFTRTTELYLTL